jgi:hypothetical protein
LSEPTEDCVDCEKCACNAVELAVELANVLIRSSGLAEADRLELEEMVGIVDMTE